MVIEVILCSATNKKMPSGNLVLGLDFKMLEKINWCAELQSLEQNAQSSPFCYPPDVSPVGFQVGFRQNLGP